MGVNEINRRCKKGETAQAKGGGHTEKTQQECKKINFEAGDEGVEGQGGGW